MKETLANVNFNQFEQNCTQFVNIVARMKIQEIPHDVALWNLKRSKTIRLWLIFS